MKTVLIAGLLALGATAALAQDEAQIAAAQALVLPMLQEMAPGRAGEVLTGCVIAAAMPEEIAMLAAAGAPSTEIGAMLSEVLARPAATDCISAAASE